LNELMRQMLQLHGQYSPMGLPLHSLRFEEGGGDGSGGAAGGGGEGGDAGKAKDTGNGQDEPMFDVPAGDGKTIRVNQAELITLASKAAGADRKFEEAAELRKQFGDLDAETARNGARIMALGQKLTSGRISDTEAQEFCDLLGLDPQALMAEAKSKGQDKPPEPPKKITLDDLDPRLRTVLEGSEESLLEKTKENIAQKVRNAIDSDAHLTKIRDAVPANKRDSFDNVLYEMAIEETLGKVYQGQQLGPELLQLTVQRLRHRLDSIGIPTEKPTLPTSKVVDGLEYLGREVGSNEPIKREPVSSSKYEDNATARFVQRLTQAVRGGVR